MDEAWPSALRAFARTLRENPSAALAAQPEDQLKAPVQALLRAAGTAFGRRVETASEVRVAHLPARPDIGVLVDGLLCGHVELKAPGKGARAERLKGADKAQWDKLRALPNLIYTDGHEWALYHEGVRHLPPVDLGDGDGGAALGRLLHAFLGHAPLTPASPRALAQLLAPRCHHLREEALAALAREDSALFQIARLWRDELFPEADDRQVADAYAQTLTYALLLARFEGHAGVDAHAAERVLEHRHSLLARSLRLLADPQVREDIGLSLDLLERSIRAVEPEALRPRGSDPWLYFYEDFLAAYDPRLRNDRGVYYTPHQVIGAQCRLIEQLLEQRFDKPLGFADEDVVTLDPGAGTGAYLRAVVESGLARVSARLGQGAVSGRASLLADNVHGFEVLPGPYAVAHLQLARAVLAAGGELPAEGVHIYLTDTLDNPYARDAGAAGKSILQRPLTEEHRRATRVKAERRVLVCLGNPPYDRQAIEPEQAQPERGAEALRRREGWVQLKDGGRMRLKGGWVRWAEPGTRALLEDFLEPAREAGASVHLKNLYNDYVYFWRWALWKVFEEKLAPQQPAQAGIVSFITAASYLRGPGFVGMRRVMRQVFDELWLLDLEGDRQGARQTENVFAIKVPVVIALGVRYGSPRPATPARARYACLTGSREAKLERLARIARFEDLAWQDCPAEWSAPFLPEPSGAYFDWPALGDVFPWQHAGLQFKRTWPIGVTREVLARRWEALLARKGGARAAAFRETRDRVVASSYRASLGRRKQLSRLASLPRDAAHPRIVRIGHRSLDRKWMLADARLGDFLRPALWAAHGPRQVYLTSLLTEVLGHGPAATVCAHLPDLHHFRGSFGGKHVIPLWRDAAAREPNITAGLLEHLTRESGAPVGAEDLFAYAYALLAAPAYVERFWHELKQPGPRLPLTRTPELFRRGGELGRRLVCLHTFGERFSDGARTRLPPGDARCTISPGTTPETYPEHFEYDPARLVLRVGQGGEFAPVARAVWEYGVSGFDVVASWLAGRMREPAGRQSSPLDEIRPERWTAALTEELLELLWAIEGTLALVPELERLLDEIVAGPLFQAAELPRPSAALRQPPLSESDDGEDDDAPAQRRLPTD